MSVQGKVIPLPERCVRTVSIDEYGDLKTDHWNPVRTNDWEVDNNYGREVLARTLNFLGSGGSGAIVFAVMRTLIAKGHFHGVEAGYVMAMIEALTIYAMTRNR